jgi:hypothetical protein
MLGYYLKLTLRSLPAKYLFTVIQEHTVAQLVEALRYEPEGRGFDFQRGHWRTMAVGPTQSLTEMSTKNILETKGQPVRWADNLTAICEQTVQKLWEPRRLTTL